MSHGEQARELGLLALHKEAGGGYMAQWEPGRGIVEFPDGRKVRGRGLRSLRRPAPAADFGVYLTGRRPQAGAIEHRWARWRDFRLPDSTDEVVAALREARERSATQRVEIACGAGFGRTGAALSVLAVMSGIPAEDAVAWVREHYHRRAVETSAQERWVLEVAASLRG
ncbi:protein-tyrosine phosphatase family protein [Glutamicibacter protophormiae]|uniref:protein-tyrosine phosphatase family protein n=1 Tax=Glutamicibacter protophormiae TaxID=37930 RepID=UPI002A801889|nr:protein-tyrosine phosphatase family protein [Glutamicibacter protophormiae]WPR63569.1 protein-tyrosine phosphatase family protein [Glutamicibacter protophormiae]WPR67064.1 protein-tyrosine phosphatase family protein [Glutamicibacter protophormiae]